MEYPLDDRGKWQYLVEENILKADGQLFRIYHKQKTLSGISCNARHIFYDLLDNFLEDVRPENQNGAGALDWILTHTQYTHPFTSMSDIDHTDTAYYVAKNPVEAILGNDDQSFVNRWGGEIVRDNFTVKMLQARGLDRGVLISYGKNIQGIEETIDLDSVITRIYPVGKDGLILTEKYVDSQYINNYPHPKVRKIEFTDIDTEDALRTAAQNYFTDTQCDIPLSNYKIDFLELTKTVEYKNYAILETVYMGDTVTVRHTKLNIDLKCKVIRIKKNVLKDRIEEVELGDFRPRLSDTLNNIGNNINDIGNKVDDTKSELQQAIDNATDEINNAMGGYVLKRNGELLIMDTEDVNTAVKVWRWNEGGLGYSATGYSGPFRTAITADGHIVADFMDTGTLIASLIKTGILQSKTGKWQLDLDGEIINFGGKLVFDGSNLTLDADSVKLALGQIGGNNLIHLNDYPVGGNSTFGGLHPEGIDFYIVPSGSVGAISSANVLHLKANTKYTVSFDAMSVNSVSQVLRVDLFPDTLPETFFTVTTYAHFKYTFSIGNIDDAANCHLRFFQNTNNAQNICVCAVQLEEGENATAWKPNSDDTVNAAVSLADDDITAAVNGIDYASKIRQNADSVKIAVGQIGGNNLFKDSSFMFGIGLGNYIYKGGNCSGWFQAIAGRDHAYLVSASASGDNFVAMCFTNPGAGTYMCAFDLQAQHATADWLGTVGIQEQGGSYRWFGKANANQHSGGISTTWFRYSFKVVIPSDAGSNLAFIFRPNTLSGNYIAYDNLQLELGENVTAWRPNANELKNSTVEITDEHLRLTDSAGNYTEMNPSDTGLKWHKADGSASHDYHYLIAADSGTATGNGVTIQLPDEFRGKTFRVSLGIRGYDTGDDKHWLKGILLYVSNYDITNGRFTVKGAGNYGYIDTASYNGTWGYLVDGMGHPTGSEENYKYDLSSSYGTSSNGITFDYVAIA